MLFLMFSPFLITLLYVRISMALSKDVIISVPDSTKIYNISVNFANSMASNILSNAFIFIVFPFIPYI